jgi:GNAT superfamily N-acetyltransferase
MEKGQLVGYMGWFIVEQFRDTDRRAAYVPEWGHAAADKDKQRIYQALYRAASTQWARAGCDTHAITLLAHDRAAEQAWYWNGFGLTVVDTIRVAEPLAQPVHTALTIRKATVYDADMLEVLDTEHCAHYTQPPVFMTPRTITTADAWREFISRENNTVWMAADGNTPAGFIRFDGNDGDGVGILEGADSVFISGAYVREAYRGQRAAPALLDAALRDYQSRSFTRCTVNFESFNPEAAMFWMRYFSPVAWSLVRVPEGRLEI